jgi:hypothetical protein
MFCVAGSPWRCQVEALGIAVSEEGTLGREGDVVLCGFCPVVAMEGLASRLGVASLSAKCLERGIGAAGVAHCGRWEAPLGP